MAARPGRPRSVAADRAILAATRDLLVARGYDQLRLEHVARAAGVGKATLYRRWASKEELAEALLEDLSSPLMDVPDIGDTRDELLQVVTNGIARLESTAFGPVVRSLLSQIAINPLLGEPFGERVVGARRDQVRSVLRRGVERGDLRPDVDDGTATELLLGPVYFRFLFGGAMDTAFAERVVDSMLDGCRAEP